MAKQGVLVSWTIVLLLLVGGAGCGSDDGSEAQEAAEVQREFREAKRQVAIRQARAQARREARRRRIRLEVKREREARRREARRREAREARAVEAEEAEAEESASSCDPNYAGACLDPAASDYDCEGGSGDGPYYTGIVTVTGEDRHGLDSDSDGVGCE